MKRTLAIICFLFTVSIGYSQPLSGLKNGTWTGKLYLQNRKEILPFKLTIKQQTVTIQNGSEQIVLDNAVIQNDSIVLRFPTFNSQLVVRANSKKHLSGYWINKNRNTTIPCDITYGYVHRFPVKNVNRTVNLSGKWEVTFDAGTANSYKGQAIIEQDLSKVVGTIRTETGDFKYLEGNITGDSVFFSRFDGAHVFLLRGKIEKDQISGLLYSGKSNKSSWEAMRNPVFELADPDSLTYLISESPLIFSLLNSSGTNYSFPNSSTSGKVVLIELMGSWCPNCLDEALFLKELYTTYTSDQLSIISIAYEVGDNYHQQAEKVNRMAQKLNLPYTILIGGKASKQVASEQFPMLNHVMSFPTTLFIDKKGNIRKVHTGFNGPATGMYYNNFKKETIDFIDQLIAE